MTERETENKGHQVFISYANEKGDEKGADRQIADMICSALESENIRCWIDHRNIMPGEKWVNAMFNAVEQSKIMVLVFSENANRSQWVEDEITYALDEKIRIIPFRVEKVTPRGALRVLKVRSQWIDAQQPPQQKDLKRLVDAVRTYLEKDKENEKQTAATDVEIPVNNGVKEKEYEQKPGVRKNEKVFQENDFGDGIIMVYIPPGELEMGSNEYDNEKPPHKVYLDGYWMGKYEVTIKQYMKFVNETQSHYPIWMEKGNEYNIKTGSKDYYKKFVSDENCPIVGVSWHNAKAYCDWISNKTGLDFKLPTEAQWEKAARGNDGRKYPWGGREPDETLANFFCKIGKTTPVGSYPAGASPYGLLDMAGNVWEWCRDWYDDDYYKNSPKENPTGPDSGTSRVVRGGGWSLYARYLRCSDRCYYDRPSSRGGSLGFRLCQDS